MVSFPTFNYFYFSSLEGLYMNQVTRLIIAIVFMAFVFTSAYLVFYTKHDLVGLAGIAMLICVHLFFKFKAKPEWSKV